MSDLKSQKRMAADILDVGENRVWIDPDHIEKVQEAITRKDIRNLIEGGTIQKRDKKGTSQGRSREVKNQKKKKRRKGTGSRKGKKTARKDDKQEWMEKVRALRKRVKEMRDEEEINSKQYRKLYSKISGGYFRDLNHLETYMEDEVNN